VYEKKRHPSGRLGPEGLVGIHTNLLVAALNDPGSLPADTEHERAALAVSQHLEPEYARRLVQEKPAGAGYLLKERVGRIEHLLDALERVGAGECVGDRAVVDELLTRPRRADPLVELTPREREILALMAGGRSNQGICKVLWLSPKTVETHIRRRFHEARDLGGTGRQSARARRPGLPPARVMTKA
jgi:DNA-binding NarL/FixJ family response regulator